MVIMPCQLPLPLNNPKREFQTPADEFYGRVIGSMPPIEFLESVMKTQLSVPPMSEMVSFKSVAASLATSAVSRNEMYAGLIQDTQKYSLTPGFLFDSNSQSRYIVSNGSLPILGLFRRSEGSSQADWANQELIIQMHTGCGQDPFRHIGLEDPAVEETVLASRRELTNAVKAQFARQHRTCLYVLVISSSLVRFSRWDRSGILVTEGFDIQDCPWILARFFLVLCHMSEAERGFDTSATLATKTEDHLLRRAIRDYSARIRDGKARWLPDMEKTIALDYPTYKIWVNVSGSLRYFAVKKPFFQAKNIFGRGTRGYVALDLEQRKLVFLKDSWPSQFFHPESEAAIYRELFSKDVPFLPELISAARVYTGSTPQTTMAGFWSMVNDKWKQSRSFLHNRYHHRIVQEIAFPLYTALCSREAVQAVRDAIEALAEVNSRCGRLHCDISNGNIMFSDVSTNGAIRARGVLNDWDQSRKPQDRVATYKPRTGTWPSMSIALGQAPFKQNEIQDDYESCFWVLLHTALLSFKHDSPYVMLDLFNNMDPPFVDQRGRKHPTIGVLKDLYLREGNGVKFACEPLNDLLDSLRSYWLHFYECRHGAAVPSGPWKTFEEWRTAMAEYPTDLLEIFDSMLSRTDWIGSDAVYARPLSHRLGDIAVSETQDSQETKSLSQSEASSLKLRRFNGGEFPSVARSRLSLHRGKKRSASDCHPDVEARNQKKAKLVSNLSPSDKENAQDITSSVMIPRSDGFKARISFRHVCHLVSQTVSKVAHML